MICVYECGCKDLGEDGRLYVVLLGSVFSAVMEQNCAGVVELSACSRSATVCAGVLNSCGEDCVQLCVLVHTGCTRQDRFSATPTARPTGFVVDVGDQDF